jgi:hypothetical protein
MTEQISMFSKYLDSIIIFNSTVHMSSRDKASAHNKEQLTKQLASYAKKRQTNLSFSLKYFDSILPTYPSFDKTNKQHKQFLFMTPMIVCEVKKS